MKKKVLELRPTQMALGIREVEYRVRKLEKMNHAERDEYLHKRRVPVVVGKHSRLFIVDHHHLVRSCWEVGIEEVPVEQLADLSHLKPEALWEAMHRSHWIYPYDQLGNGPHDPIHLPESVQGMADDPYRSLAWLVREQGGFQKCETPFSEFQWANFFRKKLKTHPVDGHFEEALKEALELAQGESGKHLPGHRSR